MSSASSQLMRRQPGSAEPFGLVRIIGYCSRSGWAVIAGASLPLTHSTFPVGCDGSRFSVNVPSVTVARAPQRDTHNGQYVATSVEVGASGMYHLPRSAPGLASGAPSLGPRETA